MQGRNRRIVTLVVFLALLAGCDGGGAATETPLAPGDWTPAPIETAPGPGDGTPAATAPPAPTPGGPRATVVDVINDVDADPLSEGDWLDAEPEMAIYVGGHVRAQEASTARVAVEEGLVRVAPNTLFTFEPVGGDTLQLNLQEGQMWIGVDDDALEGKTFEVETPAASASVRGTRFGARVGADGTTIFSTQVGTVTVSAEGAAVEVGAGYQTTVAQGDAPGASVPMPPDEQVRWGMAMNDGLDVVLPVVDASHLFTYTKGYVTGPQCSYDGRYVSFSYKDVVANDHGYLFYDLSAGEPVTPALPADARNFTFNPADEGLAYEYQGEVCTAGMDGTTQACFRGANPVWSPAGDWLLAGVSNGGLNLYKARPDGSEVTQLTFYGEGYARRAAWHDSRIAYVWVPPESGDPASLWVMGDDGSGAQVVLTETYTYGAPAWNTDGSLLAVALYGEGGSGGEGGLGLVRSDGSGVTVVPGTVGQTPYGLTWSPTKEGWPLFYRAYDDGREQYRLWYVRGPGESAEPFVYAQWGPNWCLVGEEESVFLTGFQIGTTEKPQMSVYSFSAVQGFWAD